MDADKNLLKEVRHEDLLGKTDEELTIKAVKLAIRQICPMKYPDGFNEKDLENSEGLFLQLKSAGQETNYEEERRGI